jgi:hypothetical protein
MKALASVFALIFIVLSVSITSRAKEWRGITPLHSTREDVERLLGPPPPPPTDGTMIYKHSKARSIYFLEEGKVYIVFEEKEVSAAASCIGAVPAGTVLLIEITPKKAMELRDLQIDESRFRKFDPSEPPNIGFMAYANDDEGISIRTQDGKVQQINYYAAAKDASLCPSYYSGPKRFCGLIVDFIRPDETRKDKKQEKDGKP